MTSQPLFDRIRWQDPLTGSSLEPRIGARTPSGVPITGALIAPETGFGYPIVDSVPRLTPELAHRYREWLSAEGLEPPPLPDGALQAEATVDSFGFQWSWNSAMRSETDLRWRVARQFGLTAEFFKGKRVLDAGAGAGDQSRWMLEQGAEVVSIDLSSAIDVVARKLRAAGGWCGAQGDITRLPLADGQFDVVYCEGVIQHTRDSAATVRELKRMLVPGGVVLATHYELPSRLRGKVKMRWTSMLRRRFEHMERYKLLFVTGALAALGSVPLLGRGVRLSGTAFHSELMPDFRTTWTNTFDFYGNHAFQRHITPAQFWKYFEDAGEFERLYEDGARIVARYTG